MPKHSGEWVPNGLCSLFICDVASFGHQSRTDLDRHKIRTAFYDGLRKSFDGAGIPYDACYREDRGDGALVAVPPSFDTTILLTSLVHRLRAEVRRHNDVSTEAARMRLRLAVHTGVVHSDDEGLVGTAVNYAFRILEAPQLKLLLQRTGTEVALITSERVYDDVIRHGIGLADPAEFHRVELRVKETATAAWITVPGLSAPVRPVLPAPPAIADARVVVSVVPTASDPPRLPAPDPPQLPASDSPQLPVSGPPRPPVSGPPQLPPAGVTVADRPPGLGGAVDRALGVRQLRSRHLRDQIVAELPLALAEAIEHRRSGDDRADVAAIVHTCARYPNGLADLLRVVRRFAGDSTRLDDFRKSLDELEA